MSKYIPFTTEQKERAASVDLEEFLRRRGEKLITSGRDKRLASDHSITIRGCEWFDHATEQGGRAISFVKQFYGLSYPDAMSLLLGRHSLASLLKSVSATVGAAAVSVVGDILFSFESWEALAPHQNVGHPEMTHAVMARISNTPHTCDPNDPREEAASPAHREHSALAQRA